MARKEAYRQVNIRQAANRQANRKRQAGRPQTGIQAGREEGRQAGIQADRPQAGIQVGKQVSKQVSKQVDPHSRTRTCQTYNHTGRGADRRKQADSDTQVKHGLKPTLKQNVEFLFVQSELGISIIRVPAIWPPLQRGNSGGVNVCCHLIYQVFSKLKEGEKIYVQ